MDCRTSGEAVGWAEKAPRAAIMPRLAQLKKAGMAQNWKQLMRPVLWRGGKRCKGQLGQAEGGTPSVVGSMHCPPTLHAQQICTEGTSPAADALLCKHLHILAKQDAGAPA